MSLSGTRAVNAKPKSFLYTDVASRLRERIVSGRYRPGTKLPSLHDLVSEFDVSTISIRRALKELTNEGLIFGEQGRGVFVKPKAVIHRVLPVDSNSSTGDEIARAGFEPRIRSLRHDVIKADDDTAERLGIVPRSPIHRHEKIVYADQEPVSFHTLYFPESIAHRLTPNIDKMFIFRLLHHARLKARKTRFEFGALALSADLAPLYELPIGYPMGVVYFTPLSAKGTPILTGVTIYRSDRFLYEITAPLSDA